MKRNTDAILDSNIAVGLEIYTKKTKYTFMSIIISQDKIINIKVANKSFKM
jgi:hypothetical protein